MCNSLLKSWRCSTNTRRLVLIPLIAVSFEFTDCQLKTLDGFNASKNLIKLCFEKNELDGTSIKFLADNYPDLQFLSLSVNKITNLEVSVPFKLGSITLKIIPISDAIGSIGESTDKSAKVFRNCIYTVQQIGDIG